MSGNEPPNDADYRLLARALWDYTAERLKFTSQINADYGKWLIVTITSTHLAAIYLISQPSVPSEIRENGSSYWPFIIGLCLALVCGLSVWLNWALSAIAYAKWMKVGMLTDRLYWPQETSERLKRWMPISFYLPISIGLASAACIPWGAYRAFDRQNETAYVITQDAPKPAQPTSRPSCGAPAILPAAPCASHAGILPYAGRSRLILGHVVHRTGCTWSCRP